MMNLLNQSEQGKKDQAKVRQQAAPWVILLGIIFITVNLRAPLTSVGPLVELIRNDLHISNTLAGAVTTLPLLAFAFFSPFVPKLGKRFGVERILFISLFLLTLGIILRSFLPISNLHLPAA